MSAGVSPRRIALLFVVISAPLTVQQLDAAITQLQEQGAIARIVQRWRGQEMLFFSRERINRILLLTVSGVAALLLISAAGVRRLIGAQASRRRSDEQVQLLALRASEEKYRQLVENAQDIIFTVDREGYCLSMNRAGQGITGFPGATPRGVHLAHPVVPEHQQTAMSALRRVLGGDAVPRFEVDIVSRMGRKLTLELDVHPIRVDAAIVGAQGIARDVTVRRELEAQLLQAQKVEAIGRLAGGVAHDFNNILTVVMGFAELASQQLDPQSPVRHDIEEIRRAAGSAASLTRQLLIFSRKSVVRPRVFDLNEVVGQLDKMLRRLVGAHLNFVARPGDDVGHVKAAPARSSR